MFLKQKLLIWLLVKPLQQLWWLLTLSFQWGKHGISCIVIIMNNTGEFQNVKPGWGADVKLAVAWTKKTSCELDQIAGAEQFAGHDKYRERRGCQCAAQFNFNTTWWWCRLAAVTLRIMSLSSCLQGCQGTTWWEQSTEVQTKREKMLGKSGHVRPFLACKNLCPVPHVLFLTWQNCSASWHSTQETVAPWKSIPWNLWKKGDYLFQTGLSFAQKKKKRQQSSWHQAPCFFNNICSWENRGLRNASAKSWLKTKFLYERCWFWGMNIFKNKEKVSDFLTGFSWISPKEKERFLKLIGCSYWSLKKTLNFHPENTNTPQRGHFYAWIPILCLTELAVVVFFFEYIS